MYRLQRSRVLFWEMFWKLRQIREEMYDMKQYTVTGMSCAACSARVERAVSCLDGVEACSVNLLTNSMNVEGSVPPEVNMLVLAGILLFVGACCVGIIKEKK